MSRYCDKCGMEIRQDAVFCPHCGRRVFSPDAVNTEWKEIGGFCSQIALAILKGFLYLLLGGLIFACMVNGIAALVVGAIFFYHFATAGFIVLPAFLVFELGIGSLSGVLLVFAGITMLFIAVLLIAAAVFMIRGIMTWRKKGTAI